MLVALAAAVAPEEVIVAIAAAAAGTVVVVVVLWSDYRKYLPGQVIRFRLKLEEKKGGK